MEIIDNKVGNPLKHYKAIFAGLDPAEVTARTGVELIDGKFSMTLLGETVTVSFPEGEISTGDGISVILLLRYLIEGARIEFGGKFLSYSEMPWGEVYLKAFTGRCLMRLAFSVGHKPELLKARCIELGGVENGLGDVGYDLPFFQNLTLRLILWLGDDEFPPSAQLLFSDSFRFAFSAEDMAGVGDLMINKLKA